MSFMTDRIQALEVSPHGDPRTGYAEVGWGPARSRSRKALDSSDSSVKETFVLARRRLAGPAGSGKMPLFACLCTPPYKVRTGRADFSARCTRCGELLRHGCKPIVPNLAEAPAMVGA